MLLFILLNVVYQLIVGKDLFVVVIIEKRGHLVGISESVGHAMTFKILTDNTLKVIH
jgi:hypothetical protein